MSKRREDVLPAVPWWRVRMVWLVIGGPLAVVAASFATLALALKHPDPVLVPQAGMTAAEVPAVTARNHAASPLPPAQPPSR